MKVSIKILSGFLVLILLAVVLLWNQISVVHDMQTVTHQLAETNLMAATTVGRMVTLADLIGDESKRYFATTDRSSYEEHLEVFRKEFLDDLGPLLSAADSGRERAETEKLSAALKEYLSAFDRLKQQNQTWDPDDLPPDFTIAVNHLHRQAEVTLDAVRLSIKDQAINAEAIGLRAERVSLVAGIVSLILSVIVAFVIFQSINEPLSRLTQGTKAIAKGEFWHRLPARGTDEFGDLARDFNSMTERLGELDRMKKDFVSHVSHDLKAPLASIRQIMHLLLQEIPGALNEQQRGLVQLSYNSAERLAAMVGNLLDVSRMEAGTMEYRMSSHDLIAMVKGATDEFEVQARQKGIRLRMESEQACVFVECDRERVMQVIGNLFENALKFSPGNSEIVTQVRPGKGAEILVSVADSGPGVPAGQKEKIFHKFHQIKHGNKISGQGVGLGLAICKTIVEAHHGQIWVEDNPKGGSVFTFVLQASADEETLKCGQTA